MEPLTFGPVECAKCWQVKGLAPRMKKAVDRILREQKEAADLIISGHPEQRGLRQAVADWVGEEILSGSEYVGYLGRKSQYSGGGGFEPIWVPDVMFDFQKYLNRYSCLNARTACLSDCGTGKTLMELVWAENVARFTNGRVLILTPLAVSLQTVSEGEKFGQPGKRSSSRITNNSSISVPMTL